MGSPRPRLFYQWVAFPHRTVELFLFAITHASGGDNDVTREVPKSFTPDPAGVRPLSQPPSSMNSEARTLVVDWLRAAHALGAEIDLTDETLVDTFLRRAGQSGFTCELVHIDGAGSTRYETHWTHRGASFVGFKQPAAEDTPVEALLAGCSALLQNQWCRDRLARVQS